MSAAGNCKWCGLSQEHTVSPLHAPDCPTAEIERLKAQLALCGESLLRSSDGMLSMLRGAGWVVAVHNDYVLDGRKMTFWGFSRNDRWVRGEGATDADALMAVIAQTSKTGTRR